MSNQVLKEKIIQYAYEIGIDKIGFAEASPFDAMEDSLEEKNELSHSTGFEHSIIQERLYPEKIFKHPKSIIAIALAYPSEIPDPLPNERENRRGVFARASWGIDYHHILQKKMDQLITFIKKETTSAKFKPMVDTGELPDVAVAERAGLGFIGRNGLLITKEFGSWVYLGEIITDIVFEPDKRVEFGCGDCYRCIEACPPKALLGDGRLNGKRCLSYQTQTRGYMPEEYRRQISNVIYGCDICQIVCPYNQGKSIHNHPEMEPDPEIIQPALKPLLTISNREFKNKYGHLAGAWRGKKPIQRNAIIALANVRDQTALPQLLQVLEQDPRHDIRGIAAWAIAQIVRYKNEEIIICISEQLKKENEPETILEMEKALKQLANKRLPRNKVEKDR